MTLDKTIDIIVGANYGDCGKGRITAYIANHYDVDKTLIIRSSSGFQCSHTVVSGDKRHVFHGFGSGTLDGYPTYLGRDVVVNPILFKKEFDELVKLGITPKIYINKKCYVTLPSHMIANQCIASIDLIFDSPRGTCGIGVYETVLNHIYKGTYVNVNKLRDKKFYKKCKEHFGSEEWFKKRLLRSVDMDMIYECDDAEEMVQQYTSLNTDDDIWEHFYNDLCFMYDNCIVVDSIIDIPNIEHIEHYVFEMSQGILLSDTNCNRGGIAHNCTSTATVDIIKHLSDAFHEDKFAVNINYVSRWYMTRHGEPLREDIRKRDEISSKIVDNTNIPNQWQGEMVFGLLDIPSFKNRITDDYKDFSWNFKKVVNVDILQKNIYITCLDQIENGYLPFVLGHILSSECSLHKFVQHMIIADKNANIYLCLSESNNDIIPAYHQSDTLSTLQTYMFNGKEQIDTRSVIRSPEGFQLIERAPITTTATAYATATASGNSSPYIILNDNDITVDYSNAGRVIYNIEDCSVYYTTESGNVMVAGRPNTIE